jgi:organic hydroperoxide reductase OsmC/OhrA
MARSHRYAVDIEWSGNRGTGTSSYTAYDRNHSITADNRPPIAGSSDPEFRGDASRWSPEQLLLASVAQCHMLWYLHLASRAGIRVTAYCDSPTGTMRENDDGSGEFVEVTVHPVVTVDDPARVAEADRLHDHVNDLCFIARSVRFPVRHEPQCRVAVAS